jgi:CHASE2 domain-containing sensor protein/tRNA A-37 threonylcarbamoyl transferase component Bud32
MRVLFHHRSLVLLLGLALLAGSFLPLAASLENRLYAGLSRLLPDQALPTKTLVVTMGNNAVDETPSSQTAPGQAFSYPRLARLLDRLQAAGVAAIGLALPLDRAQTPLAKVDLDRWRTLLDKGLDKTPDKATLLQQLDPDGALQEALSSAHQPVLAMSSTASRAGIDAMPALAVEPPDNGLALILPLISPVPALFADTENVFLPAALPGFVQHTTPALFLQSEATVLATAPLAIPSNGQYRPSFELALAARALGVSMDSVRVHPGRGVALGTAWYATDAGLRVYPRVSSVAVPSTSAEALLAGSLADRQLRGKAVVVGLSTGLLGQAVSLPGAVTATRLQWSGQVVNAIINESFVSVPYWSLGVQRGAIMLILIYLLLLPARLRGGLGLVAGLGLVFLLLNGELLLLILRNTALPLGLPVLFLMLGHGLWYVHQRVAGHYHRLRDERDEALVELSSNLRSQGQLDAAYKRLSACAGGATLREALYQLGLDFERRRQFNKALAAYDRIAEQDANFRDIRERRARHQPLPEKNLAATTIAYASTKLVVDDPKVERQVLGRYEIERELGRGAMGTVYLGRDPRISRTVAIKTMALTEEFESTQLDEVRRRFFQEAETAGRLNHPNIVTVYDVGEEHDLAYIAMDYISGDSLDQHVRPEALLSIEQVFTIGVQVAEALDYAHEQKVVHRDVKPGNIIFDLNKGQLKVTDFGIACLTDNSKTRTGTVLGSQFYMSPEQIAGKKVDGRSDLFSLGVTLYQLFTGRLPFEGDSLTSLMYQITNEKPKGIRKLRSELPTCLTRLINKALEKHPDKRFANGQAMAEAIRRCAERCAEQWEVE